MSEKQPVNLLGFTNWTDNLYCPFCGALVWNENNPCEFVHCPHYLFTYGLGGVLDSSKPFSDLMYGNEDMEIDAIIAECSYTFPNFVLYHREDAESSVVIGIAGRNSKKD